MLSYIAPPISARKLQAMQAVAASVPETKTKELPTKLEDLEYALKTTATGAGIFQITGLVWLFYMQYTY